MALWNGERHLLASGSPDFLEHLILDRLRLPAAPVSSAQFHPGSGAEDLHPSVLDARTDKVADPSFNRIVQKHASDVLKRKRYQYEALTDPAYVAHVTSIEPQDTNSEWMPKLGPPEARWVMLFAIEVLNKYQNKITKDSQAQAVLSMVVIDKQTQSVIWRDRHSYWTGTVPSYLVAVWESNPAGRPAAAAAALMAQWHEQSGLYDAIANSVIMMLQPKFPKCQNRL